METNLIDFVVLLIFIWKSFFINQIIFGVSTYLQTWHIMKGLKILAVPNESFVFGGNNQGMQLQANTQIDIHYIEMSDWSHFQYATNMHADMVVWYEFTCMCVCVCIFDEYPNVFMSVGMDG